jgi:DNA-binding NtrC family response regulator
MNGTPISVLVLDDESTIRESLADYLEDFGLEVIPCEHAEDALEQLAQVTPDVVVVDIRLRGMSGEEFIRHAHAIKPQIRYVIHTGSVTFSLTPSLEAIGLNAEHVFHKPVEHLSQMLRFIRQLAADRKPVDPYEC